MKSFFNSLTLSATVLALGLSANGANASDAPAKSTKPACCARAEAPGQFTDQSIYQVESKWKTDDGKEIHLGDLAGRPQIVVGDAGEVERLRLGPHWRVVVRS